jgi:hypothetical protein
MNDGVTEVEVNRESCFCSYHRENDCMLILCFKAFIQHYYDVPSCQEKKGVGGNVGQMEFRVKTRLCHRPFLQTKSSVLPARVLQIVTRLNDRKEKGSTLVLFAYCQLESQ